MVTTVFGFGSPPETEPVQVPLFSDSLSGQYSVNQAMVYTAVILILVMLCTKPCIVKFKGGAHVADENQIEFQQIN